MVQCGMGRPVGWMAPLGMVGLQGLLSGVAWDGSSSPLDGDVAGNGGGGGGDLQGLHDSAAWYRLAVAWAALEGCSSAIASGRRSEAAADYGRRVLCRCGNAVPIGSPERCCCSTGTDGVRVVDGVDRVAVASAASEGCSSAIASGRRSEAAADHGRRVWCRCANAVPIGSLERCCCSTETHGLRGVGALALAASEGCSVPILAGRCSGATADLGLRVAALAFRRSWIDVRRFLRCLNAVCGTLAWRETVGQRRVGLFGHPLSFGTL